MEKTDEDWQIHFRKILNKHFQQFIIREKVPVTLLTGDISDIFTLYDTRPNQEYRAEWGAPFNFVIFEGEKPKLAIMIGEGRSYKNVKFLISRMFAKKLQVPFLGFYKKFDNDEDYVVDRVRRELKV